MWGHLVSGVGGDGGVGHIFLWHHHDHQERGDRFEELASVEMNLLEDGGHPLSRG